MGQAPRPYRSPVFATVGIGTSISNTATTYATFSTTNGWTTTTSRATTPSPYSGQVSNLRVTLSAAPGAGRSWTFTLVINGSDSSLSVTIADSSTTGTSAGPVSITAGDSLYWKSVPSGTPAALSTNGLSISCEVVTSGSYGCGLFFGSAIDLPGATTTTRYTSPSSFYSSTESTMVSVMPVGGRIRNLRVTLDNGPTATYTYTITKNGVASALTTSISGGSQNASDLTDIVNFDAGDTIALVITPSGGTPIDRYMRATVFFEPNTPAVTAVFGRITPSASTINYGRAVQTAAAITSPGTTIAALSPGIYSVKNLRLLTFSAPTAGKNINARYYINAGDAAPSVTLSDSETQGVDYINTADLIAGDVFYIKTTPTNTPTVAAITFSTLLYAP